MTELYLMHHGIKGQKWGVRRFQNENGSLTPAGEKRYANGSSPATRDEVRAAKKQMRYDRGKYSKAFDTAYADSEKIHFSRAAKENNAELWDRSNKYRDTYRESKSKYKELKRENKAAIKDTYKDIQKNTSFKEKLLYNNATRKAAAKYVVNNKMTVDEAKKKANKVAIRNTAAFLSAYGALTVAAVAAYSK